MKKLKIGAKIIVGFGIVVALMLISAVTVFLSSSTTIRNSQDIGIYSILQTNGNDLVKRFDSARINMQVMYIRADGEAYQNAMVDLNECLAIVDLMREHIIANPVLTDFSPQLDSLSINCNYFIQRVNELRASNTNLSNLKNKSNSLGEEMSKHCFELLQKHISTVRSQLLTDLSTLDKVQCIGELEDMRKIIRELENLRRQTSVMYETGDLEVAAASLHLIADIEKLIDAFVSNTFSAWSLIDMNNVRERLNTWQQNIISFTNEVKNNKNINVLASTNSDALMEEMTFMMSNVDSAMTARITNTTSTASLFLLIVLGVALISVVLALLMALTITKGITKPVITMVRAADAIAIGNMDVDVHYDSKDEIGRLSRAFERMIDGINEQIGITESIASNDLSVKVKPRGGEDKMGFALAKMLDNLNKMFRNIGESSELVSSGAHQLASGSQSLALGSTEQAAAVEELSSSISEVAQSTKENAKMADDAASLADTIKQSAQKGSSQMESMMSAVHEINSASKSISKVIKVIDDIAFQTNILALNAAVEAARAGQHGKGFAVVAEEVRNLAAKSAEAAKETGSLIENSMSKAELGARIAEATADSLNEIVQGIKQSSQLVKEIAKSSDGQAQAINQINNGVDQVTRVVQVNSATAQEIAASSEEMNAQADTLKLLIGNFILRKDSLMLDKSLNELGPASPLLENPKQTAKTETPEEVPCENPEDGKVEPEDKTKTKGKVKYAQPKPVVPENFGKY